eukprot:g7370.t1
MVEDLHLHPSRALWEGRATPSPSSTPTPPPPRVANTKASGGGFDEDFWPPVVGDSHPAVPVDGGSLGDHWSWLQKQQQQLARLQPQRVVVTAQPAKSYGLAPPSKYEQQVAAAAAGGIDRPALRGQEYRRDKKRRGPSGRRYSNSTSGSPSSSLMRSGTELGAPEEDGGSSRGFLGIRWPGQGSRRIRSDTASSRDSAGVGGVVGGVGDDLTAAPEGGGRLWVSIEGSQELGKGLGGHTVYRIQVTDGAIGDQWTVLRRFRQFEMLHRGLLPILSREPDASAYVLPPKEVFGGRHGGVIAKRLKLLKVYLDRLVTCSAAVEHRSMSSFLELDPALRGLSAYGRLHGPECVLKEGELKVKLWKGPYKPVINILEAGLHVLGWASYHAIVSPGPVFLVYRGAEDDPDKQLWVLPSRRTIGSQVRVRRVDMWKSDLEKEGIRFFLVSWENTSLLCQVDSEASLDSWAHALDEDVDLRPQQSEEDRAKVDIELKAKEAWSTREEGLWGGL